MTRENNFFFIKNYEMLNAFYKEKNILKISSFLNLKMKTSKEGTILHQTEKIASYLIDFFKLFTIKYTTNIVENEQKYDFNFKFLERNFFIIFDSEEDIVPSSGIIKHKNLDTYHINSCLIRIISEKMNKKKLFDFILNSVMNYDCGVHFSHPEKYGVQIPFLEKQHHRNFAYCRTSSIHQSTSIINQYELIKTTLEKQNIFVDMFFIDFDYSANKTKIGDSSGRPRFDELRSIVKKGDKIYYTAFDRFARDSYQDYKTEFLLKGIKMNEIYEPIFRESRDKLKDNINGIFIKYRSDIFTGFENKFSEKIKPIFDTIRADNRFHDMQEILYCLEDNILAVNHDLCEEFIDRNSTSELKF